MTDNVKKNPWVLYTWTWRVESPVTVGLSPAGSLERCRPYVPARTLAGALQAEVALRGNPDPQNNGIPQYGKIGHEMGIAARFSYLFPAEERDGRFVTWLPEYRDGMGLVWRAVADGRSVAKSDDGSGARETEALSDREFRRRLLAARGQTAVAPASGAARDATLHELDVINPYWKPAPRDAHSAPAPVYLRGFYFLRENHFSKKLRQIRELRIGGELRNGMGILRLVEGPSQNNAANMLEAWGLALWNAGDKTAPVIRAKTILAHAPLDPKGARDSRIGRGALEYLRGYHAGELGGVRKHDDAGQLMWTPGSLFTGDGSETPPAAAQNDPPPPEWTIGRYGYWHPRRKGCDGTGEKNQNSRGNTPG